MNKMTVRDIDVSRKRVLVRVDFNVPIDIQTGEITDDSRIQAALPTINYLREHDACVILVSHFGRPKGKIVEDMRLAPIGVRLSQLLGREVATTSDCIGEGAKRAVASTKPGDVLLLENVRFYAGEEKGDDGFARELSKLGDVYVNDAFGTSHRAHASISGIPKYLPAVAGFLLEKELDTLGGLLENPSHPFASIFGGAKVSDKVRVLKNIMDKVDCLLIGGAMAATFLRSKGLAVGESLVETDYIETASDLMKLAEKSGVKILLPVDVIVSREISPDANVETVSIDAIPPDQKIGDVGPKTVELYRNELLKSKTVFWNGPVGVEEIDQFASGTHTLAKLLAELDATTVIGGGSTAEVIGSLGIKDKITFVSTGGGASLEFLGGEEMPGVTALLDKGSPVR